MEYKTKGALFAVFFLFGMIITMQFRTILSAQQKNPVGESSIQALSSQLEQAIEEGIQLQEELRQMEEEREEIERQLGNDNNPLINELLTERDRMELLSGFTSVKGSGVVVTLNDAPARDPDMDPSQLIIHDGDIAAILNILKAAGAQAIAINDERIMATSKQLCAGPTILINQSRYPVPYIIKAIGDPDALYEALEESEAVVVMHIYNVQVDIRREMEVIIPGFKAYQSIGNMISGMEVVEQ